MVEEVKLDFYSGYTATYLFLDSIWDTYEGKISAEEKEEFGALMGGAYNIPGWSLDWAAAVKIFYGKEVVRSDQIFSRDCFEILICLFKVFRDQFGYPCAFLINLLQQMLKTPKVYEKEWKMWKNAIKNASTGNYINNGRED